MSPKQCKIEMLLLETDRKWYMACRAASLLMTIRLTFKVNQPFEMRFSYSCAVVEQMSTDVGRRAVPLR